MLSRLDALVQLVGLIVLCGVAFAWHPIAGWAAVGVTLLIVGENVDGVTLHWKVIAAKAARAARRQR